MIAAKSGGVAAIHAHNHTKFDRVVSMTPNAAANIRELVIKENTNGYNSYSNLRPGVYKFNIDGSDYAVVIHHNLIMSDEFIIKDLSTIFELYNGVQYYSIPYKIQSDLHLSHRGFTLVNTLDDPLDAVVLHGFSAVNTINTFDQPGSISHTTGFVAYTTNKDSIVNDPVQIPIKTTLKSLHDIHDEVVLDMYRGRATFTKKLVDTTLTGIEEMEYSDSYPSNTDSTLVHIKMPGIKSNSDLYCTHCPKVIYDEIVSGSIGICSDPRFGWNLHMRVPSNIFGRDIIDFKNTLGNMYKSGNGIRIMYEPISPIYNTILLDECNIPLNYKRTQITIIPNIKAGQFSAIYNNTYSHEHEVDEYFWNTKYSGLNLSTDAIMFYKSLDISTGE